MKTFNTMTINEEFTYVCFSITKKKVVLQATWKKISGRQAELVKVNKHGAKKAPQLMDGEYIVTLGVVSTFYNKNETFNDHNVRFEMCQ